MVMGTAILTAMAIVPGMVTVTVTATLYVLGHTHGENFKLSRIPPQKSRNNFLKSKNTILKSKNTKQNPQQNELFHRGLR